MIDIWLFVVGIILASAFIPAAVYIALYFMWSKNK
jgi:hypothetical protein